MRDDGISLDSKKYSGSRVSRKALRESVGEDSEESENTGNSDDSEGSGDDLADSEDDFSDSEEESADTGDDGEDESPVSDDDSGTAESDIENKESNLQQDDSSQRAQLKAIMAREQKNIVSQLAEASQQDASRGEAVQHQMNIYERILDGRIQAQKALASANRLPLDKSHALKVSTENTPALVGQAKSAVHDLLNTICDLRVKLMKSDGILGEDDDCHLSHKRKFSTAVENAAKLDSKLEPYRVSTLSKWSRKVQASSGATSLQSSKFKAFNQTADVQVQSVLADMDRLVKRTKINRSNYVKVGMEKSEEDKEREAILQSEDVQDKLQDSNSSIFDDSDFYQTLLRELVDKRMADNQMSSGMKWTVSKSKVKKNVDTRASKGRKLRYHVQEKIQGFDAPRNVFTWTDEQADELFSSLLGQKLRVDEEEPEEEIESEAESEVENDGLAIFG